MGTEEKMEYMLSLLAPYEIKTLPHLESVGCITSMAAITLGILPVIFLDIFTTNPLFCNITIYLKYLRKKND